MKVKRRLNNQHHPANRKKGFPSTRRIPANCKRDRNHIRQQKETRRKVLKRNLSLKEMKRSSRRLKSRRLESPGTRRRREVLPEGQSHWEEKSKKRKVKQKLRMKHGGRNFHEGRKGRQRGPPPPTKSVVFIDNTGGGELARRFQEAEEEQGRATEYRVRVAESAGSALSMVLPSSSKA